MSTDRGNDDWMNLPIAKANPNASKEVILSLPGKMQRADSYIDPSYSPGDIIYYPDGRPVEGQNLTAAETMEAAAVAAGCSGTVYAGSYGYFGVEDICSVVIWGHRGYEQRYYWGTGSKYETTCMKGRGYYFDRSGYPVKKMWDLGCRKFHYTGVSVPWGNVIGNPSVRAASLGLTQQVGWWV
ncbi:MULTISPECIES: hypothetical protein [unclassified Isoptericola]|uniref:hypothetical protein n=1 Tax=unclassified Isoptericola TaxID=2623355 RepID=UPI0027130AD6|nr:MULTISPECIES: hypothetical protein [unclassified Isoptericola]MDO8143552.1 hypothetical protein [Isoptericola sp. 178]MDO8147418.1 hypothetical protein [Isoptericola sp. b515]MDO8150273.1 hypothetical protein [Isoptericola sp. b408]